MQKIWRRVVGHEQRPFDRDSEGNILTVPMDVLECGHVLRTTERVLLGQPKTDMIPPRPKRRNCTRCQKESGTTR